MKKKMGLLLGIVTVLCGVLLAGCGADAQVEGTTEKPLPAQTQTEPEQPVQTAEQVEDLTLEDLLGKDYIDYIAETITMNMENRMDKAPEVEYFPVIDRAPVTDYVTIDGDLPFTINENGDVVLTFPAGALTDEAHGEQSFILPRLYH